MGSPEAKTRATGAAGTATSSGASGQLERCDRPIGTLALLEDKNSDWYRVLTGEYRLTSTVRLLVQQGNCFVVVERVRSFQQMTTERALDQSGELRRNSNFGKGQMVLADGGLTPTVIFSARDTGGIARGLGGISRHLGLIGAIRAGVKLREASTMLALVDVRSGVQVSASEGSSSKADLSIVGGLIGTGAGGRLGGYSNTPEGKLIAAAFIDAYNQIVWVLRNYNHSRPLARTDLATGSSLDVTGDRAPSAPAAAPTTGWTVSL